MLAIPARTLAIPALVLTLVLVAPATVGAQAELEGDWRLQASVTLSGEETPCEYQGELPLTQEESQWSGPAELFLTSGPASCPAEMTGDMTGNIDQGENQIFITGFIDGTDPSGLASFTGTISPNPGGGGTFAVEEGPFAGEEGSWAAALQHSMAEIPAAGPVALLALTALLLAAGAWMLARSNPA